MPDELSFPRQYARTQRFTLGTPRAFAIAPDGTRIAFLRGKNGTDRATCLWTADPETGAERLIADPVRLLAGTGGEQLTEEEKARRERSRQGAAGIVDFAADRAVRCAVFALSGRLFVADLTGTDPDGAGVRELPAQGPVIDPRPNPDGTRVAYLSGGALRVIGIEGTGDRALAAPDGPNVTYGAADFIAAEELDRHRGYWWSPDGSEVLAARVDDSPVSRWHIADPANPQQPAREIGYPAAGTANALVGLVRLGLDGARTPVTWERAGRPGKQEADSADGSAFEYLASVHWSMYGPPLLVVLSRDQRTARILALAPDGSTKVLVEERDPAWIESFPGSPCWSPSGEPAWIAPRGDAYRLLLGDRVLTADEVQVRALLGLNAQYAFLSVSFEDPTRIHVVRVRLADGTLTHLGSADGVNTAVIGGSLAVLTSATLDEPNRRVAVLRIEGPDGGAPKQLSELRSVTARPSITARPRELVLGERALRGALMLPSNHVPGTKLPVLLDPYGGPHGQLAVASHNAYLSAQWFAEQGFAVLVADGRGTPGRGPAWDRSVRDDFAGATLDDQVDALHSLLAQFPDLDRDRVAIRGWSYGGYLSALAVLKRPDVFHAAVVGAPVTDWRMYDTGYTERYLGHPDQAPEIYNANSLFPDAGPGAWQWAEPHRPMMIIHGLADDNVVAAHTLRLSSALLAAGRPHEVLPLSGVTHMTPAEVVTENLMLLQIDFLRRALAR
ncbi:S9 family peptidase [Actinocrinis puniceicyclus]|uniref:S9 family peptidase n=1 Tax=Actinocrinis puniceicyclus TaxID=977794 RepID=A0A8J8BA25_9ACTN|nr:prolyl oligopeptidase family serine peptidase [Actinocrinis puniceicyclus]MBS2962482.1 S9 family peptidase [Actinocrinis puniceicyclus]